MNAIAADRPTAAVTDHHRSTDHCDRERRERGLECFWEESLIHNAKQEEEGSWEGWSYMEDGRLRGVAICVELWGKKSQLILTELNTTFEL